MSPPTWPCAFKRPYGFEKGAFLEEGRVGKIFETFGRFVGLSLIIGSAICPYPWGDFNVLRVA